MNYLLRLRFSLYENILLTVHVLCKDRCFSCIWLLHLHVHVTWVLSKRECFSDILPSIFATYQQLGKMYDHQMTVSFVLSFKNCVPGFM